MSDVAAVALITGVITGVVGLVGLAFNFLNSSSEREYRLKQQESEQEERYRIGLYEKRLEIHQQAFTWTQTIGRTAFRVQSDLAQVHQLGTEIDEFRDWIASINLYLDPVSQHELTRFLYESRQVVLGKSNYAGLSAQGEAAQTAIVKGIALKHIDFEAIKEDLRKMREESHDR